MHSGAVAPTRVTRGRIQVPHHQSGSGRGVPRGLLLLEYALVELSGVVNICCDTMRVMFRYQNLSELTLRKMSWVSPIGTHATH